MKWDWEAIGKEFRIVLVDFKRGYQPGVSKDIDEVGIKSEILASILRQKETDIIMKKTQQDGRNAKTIIG